MSFKFKTGDKVRVVSCPFDNVVGKEGIVIQLGGRTFTREGAVVDGEEFPSGDHGKHRLWFPDHWLELVAKTKGGIEGTVQPSRLGRWRCPT